MTSYICHVGALSKAEDILEWNMGLVLTYARILFQRNETRCVALKIKDICQTKRILIFQTGCVGGYPVQKSLVDNIIYI